jgi:hypothetical protein
MIRWEKELNLNLKNNQSQYVLIFETRDLSYKLKSQD